VSTPALDRLVEDLREEFEGEARGSHIAELLAGYAGTESDWQAVTFFADHGYTRNLVAREERFELLLLAWGAGQESPIHNHEGQDCWMGVVEGQIEEVRYCKPEEVGSGPLEPRGSQIFSQGEVAFIRDEIGLHLVRSGSPDRPAVSLHLYASPYDQCNVYCPQTGKITRKDLRNYSVRGRILATSSGGS